MGVKSCGCAAVRACNYGRVGVQLWAYSHVACNRMDMQPCGRAIVGVQPCSRVGVQLWACSRGRTAVWACNCGRAAV